MYTTVCNTLWNTLGVLYRGKQYSLINIQRTIQCGILTSSWTIEGHLVITETLPTNRKPWLAEWWYLIGWTQKYASGPHGFSVFFHVVALLSPGGMGDPHLFSYHWWLFHLQGITNYSPVLDHLINCVVATLPIFWRERICTSFSVTFLHFAHYIYHLSNYILSAVSCLLSGLIWVELRNRRWNCILTFSWHFIFWTFVWMMKKNLPPFIYHG